jgi:hypothetical protein
LSFGQSTTWKKLLRHWFSILIGALAILAGIILYFGVFPGGEVLQQRPSPDGRFIAACREYKQHSATSSNLTTVDIRGRWNPLWHTVLTGFYGDHFSLEWPDTQHLQVRCGECLTFDVKCDACDGFYIVNKETRYHEISIEYIAAPYLLRAPKRSR